MADPKYANLPGIAHDQPDCYETSDLPEADQNVPEEDEEESEFVTKVKINATESFQKFSNKTLTGDHVDFSDRLSKAKKIGYDARSREWEVAALGEVETPAQRLERLKLETKELLQDIQSLKEDKKEEPNIGEMQPTLQNMLYQLESLRWSEVAEATEAVKGESQLPEAIAALNPPSSDATPVIRYNVTSHPSGSLAHLAGQVAKLESSVSAMSKLLTGSDSVPPPSSLSLCDLAREVDAKASLVQVAQLDAADARAAALLVKLDRIAERATELSSTPAHDHNRINELYELSKKCGELSTLGPAIVDRLTTLESVHQKAADFTERKSELEATQKMLQALCEENKKAVTRLEENLSKNLDTIKASVDSLNERLNALGKK